MIDKIKTSIAKLRKAYPEWEEIIDCYYRNQDISEDNADVIDEFNAIIITICDSVKGEKCNIEDAIDLFSDKLQKDIEVDIRKRLRPYFECAAIRKNEKNNRNQLELIVDELWNQRILQRNPLHRIDTEKNTQLIISNEEAERFSITLSAIVDHCVSRLLSYEGIISVISSQTGISKELSAYIARKIEKDSEVLRTNYIIKKLTILSSR